MEKILLLDVKEFGETEGKVIYFGLRSYNMNGKVPHTWSNGWCPISQIKLAPDGSLIGRISNESVPVGIYSGYTVNDSTFNKEYWVNRWEELHDRKES